MFSKKFSNKCDVFLSHLSKPKGTKRKQIKIRESLPIKFYVIINVTFLLSTKSYGTNKQSFFKENVNRNSGDYATLKI